MSTNLIISARDGQLCASKRRRAPQNLVRLAWLSVLALKSFYVGVIFTARARTITSVDLGTTLSCA
jgi:hypothetical protein